jgi:hypothetical protein
MMDDDALFVRMVHAMPMMDNMRQFKGSFRCSPYAV